MKLQQVKLVAYVGLSRRGKWPVSAVVSSARQVAAREAVTGGLMDDGVGVFHVVEGSEAAVDRFMAYVLLSGRIKGPRVVYEAHRSARMFEGQPLAHCTDEAWRPRLAALMAAQSLDRHELWRWCSELAECARIASPPSLPSSTGDKTLPARCQSG